MPKTRRQKEQEVEALVQRVKEARSIIVNSFSALPVEKDRDLRNKLREEEVIYKVFKKRLFALVLRKAKLKEINLEEVRGNLSVALSQREVEAAKLLKDFMKENENFDILGGFIDKKYLSKEKILALADLPSKEELLAQFVYLINTPLKQLIGILEDPLREFIGILRSLETAKTKIDS